MTDTRTFALRRCVIETTLACDLRCAHCGSRAGRARPNELTTSELEDVIRQLADLGCRRVTLSGGEALVRPDWPDLITAVTRSGMVAAMISNGLRFDDDTALLARDCGLRTVGISIDGVERTHDRLRGRIGHFRAAVSAMGSARRAGLSFTMITQLSLLNLSELGALYELAREQGAFSWQVQTTLDMGRMRGNSMLLLRPSDVVGIERSLAELIRRGEQRIAVCNSIGYFGRHERVLRRANRVPCFPGCGAGMRTLGIESNGDVKGCLALMAGHDGRGVPFVEGNVRDTRLADIWHRPGAFAYNRQWSCDDLDGFCRICEHVERCRGGCLASRLTSGGAENLMCVHRVLNEGKRPSRQAGMAAAAVLAALMGVTQQECGSERSGDGDTDTDTDIDGDTDVYDVDTDIDIDSDIDSDVYDVDTDTDSGTDTETDTDTDTDSGTDSGTDTGTDTDTGTGTDSE